MKYERSLFIESSCLGKAIKVDETQLERKHCNVPNHRAYKAYVLHICTYVFSFIIAGKSSISASEELRAAATTVNIKSAYHNREKGGEDKEFHTGWRSKHISNSYFVLIFNEWSSRQSLSKQWSWSHEGHDLSGGGGGGGGDDDNDDDDGGGHNKEKMGLIPRRHRSLLYKLLVIIPLLWLTVAFLLYSEHRQSSQQNSLEDASGVRLAEANRHKKQEVPAAAAAAAAAALQPPPENSAKHGRGGERNEER